MGRAVRKFSRVVKGSDAVKKFEVPPGTFCGKCGVLKQKFGLYFPDNLASARQHRFQNPFCTFALAAHQHRTDSEAK